MSTLQATVRSVEKLVAVHAQGAASLASQLAPRSDISDPGYQHMADSIGATQLGRAWLIVVGKDYAPHVEYGTIYMDAIPFFRPALASAQRALRRDLKVVVGKESVKSH